MLIITVYIPPGANARVALSELYGAISNLVHPDGFFIVTGYFNHVNLKRLLPKFHQHVDFATNAKTLDLILVLHPAPTSAARTTSLLC